MPNKPRSHQVEPDSPGYTQKWARDIVDAVGKREARRILARYIALSDNKRLAKADRETAAERVEALSQIL